MVVKTRLRSETDGLATVMLMLESIVDEKLDGSLVDELIRIGKPSTVDSCDSPELVSINERYSVMLDVAPGVACVV